MGSESKAKAPPKVVKLDKALKLAEAWVNNMSTSATNEQSELEFEGQPSRLGLGAKVTPKMKVAVSSDPVEQKLLGKLNSKKKLSYDNIEKASPVRECSKR
ncbi:uncharacterized protein LOC135598578 [Musa acuminata AAA Group]|uniref:uncharacterized protein LOC135598578 n=1 Tax=Musa acuminata AAA Group TaxID=214697 RepID=UPI0031D9CA7C